MVQMVIQFNGKTLVLPVNPESITPSRSASNTDIDIVGLGPATRKGHPGLYKFTIETFFPGPKSYFYKGDDPATCVNFINTIWTTPNTDNNVAQFIVTGIPLPIDMYFVIENFSYDHSAGQEEDIPFKLEIKEYVPYGVKFVDPQTLALDALKNNRVNSPLIENTNTENTQTYNTYTVESGDCLYNITKACTGNGNQWGALYELNKDIINNPRLIKPGQVLKLPEGWNTPVKVAKLKNTSKKSNATVSQLTNKPTGDVSKALELSTASGQAYDDQYKVEKTVASYANIDKPAIYYTRDVGDGVAEIVDFDAKPAGDQIITDKKAVTKQVVLPQKR